MTPALRSLAALMALLLTAQTAAGQSDPASAARAAAEAIHAAGAQLSEAENARDRVAALTETTRAFEAGLAAMREGLRRVSTREAELAQDLRAREDEVARLLGTLQVMGGQRSPVVLLHPAGALGTARAAMIVADVSRGLNQQADELRDRLDEARVLRQLQQSAADTLAEGLRGVQTARTELSQAVADRTDLPRKFTEDPIKTALLIASTETLDAFASGLTGIAEEEQAIALPSVTDRKGDIPLPVLGRVLRRAGEADAAGVTRPGIVVATRPRALVTTPTAATIRYRGPLLDYGNVMILEPEPGILFVFAGLDVVYGAAGNVLAAGAPVGLMGGPEADLGAVLSEAQPASGAGRSETLYIEVREDNTPQNPGDWFRGTED
ncbi:murein hydrolase activator EnvC family protein [Pseudooceanicola sp. C21-150M6]|uniref:murein hydrolase activator EnvC family protein n=1 Tax=Pseudooceanicola sp. C21-150M6 TaxID=3434355 RepID=UPI003D7FB52B